MCDDVTIHYCLLDRNLNIIGVFMTRVDAEIAQHSFTDSIIDRCVMRVCVKFDLED